VLLYQLRTRFIIAGRVRGRRSEQLDLLGSACRLVDRRFQGFLFDSLGSIHRTWPNTNLTRLNRASLGYNIQCSVLAGFLVGKDGLARKVCWPSISHLSDRGSIFVWFLLHTFEFGLPIFYFLSAIFELTRMTANQLGEGFKTRVCFS
jgi:hypothetical protein